MLNRKTAINTVQAFIEACNKSNITFNKVILFGSYAYGQPGAHSDVDLLVVKDLAESVLRDKVQIRRAWWKMPRREPLLPFDLILVSPERHQERLENAGGFYDEIVHKGLKLV